MQKSFQTFIWFIVFGLTFVNIYAQLKSEGQPSTALDNSVKSYFINSDAECTGEGQLIYDDGTFENGYGWVSYVYDGRFLQLATPFQYKWQLNTFCIALSRTGPDNVFNFDIIIYDNSGVGGIPGNLVATIPDVIATGIPQWPGLAFYDYDISSVPVLISGSYYVGIKFNASIELNFFIGADESVTTPLWPCYASYDGGVIWEPNQIQWPDNRAMGIRTLGSFAGPVCPVEPATDPTPANGTTGVNINTPGNATWTNGVGTSQVEVFFGPVGNVVSIYSGTPITSFEIPTPLNYYTTYQWRVVCKNDTCSADLTATWSFTTEEDPLSVSLFFDDFESGQGLWTITNDGGSALGVWTIFTPPYPSTYQLPVPAGGGVFAADADYAGTSSLTTATVTNPMDATLYQSVTVEFDNDWQARNLQDFGFIEVSVDGINWITIKTFDHVDVRNTHEFMDISTLVALTNFYLRFRSVQPGFDWWWVIDNVKVEAFNAVPVELTSFTASINEGKVILNWTTATELNNQGFQIEKKSVNSSYEQIGYVPGFGTTTEPKAYSFTDSKITNGKYTYRLKQIDFDGSYSYSKEVEINDDITPKEFVLYQNYPNPFNPSTKIKFTLPVKTILSLNIYNTLGIEVMTMMNEEKPAGTYEVTWYAEGLPSGVYFYQLKAGSYVETMKMLLIK